jgi:hypothetical protein
VAYDGLHRIGAMLRVGSFSPASNGFAVRRRTRRSVRRSLHDRKPLRTWMDLTTADGPRLRWALELIKRGLLVNL